MVHNYPDVGLVHNYPDVGLVLYPSNLRYKTFEPSKGFSTEN